MTQVTSGIRRVLSLPAAYDALQVLLGSVRGRERLYREYIAPQLGDVVVDVGCGTAAMLDLIPSHVRYFGFDLSPEYIAAAQARYGERGEFYCADITSIAADAVPASTTTLAIGLLHHLDDDGCRHLLRAIRDRLAPGGRLITLDGTFVPNQGWMSRTLVGADRGRNIRTPEAYAALVPDGMRVATHVLHDLLRVPYEHCILVCTKDAGTRTEAEASDAATPLAQHP
jgi:SAM-dependent methyltransferase